MWICAWKICANSWPDSPRVSPKRNRGYRVAKNKLAAAREAHTTSLKDRKKYELDVEQWRERAKKYRDQSYEVKTNEAFRALQHEIANADAEMARAEDRLLERMVAGEEFDRQIKSGETGAKRSRSRCGGRAKSSGTGTRGRSNSKLSAAEARTRHHRR